MLPLMFAAAAAAAAGLLLAACGDTAELPVSAGTGPNPPLPPPDGALIPTVDIAPAKPWSGDAAPVAAAGTTVKAFASGLDHPRWPYVLPNGDVLVAAETNAPKRPLREESSAAPATSVAAAAQPAG